MIRDLQGVEELVRRHYPSGHWPVACEFLGGAGGFSGSQFWRFSSALGVMCLRRWPGVHPSRARLEMIHSVLQHASRNGFGRLPLPVPARSGESFVSEGGHFWQLEPWISGKADYRECPSERRLAGALRTLAEFHQAVADHPTSSQERMFSPGMAERRAQLERLAGGQLAQLQAEVQRARDPRFDAYAARLLPLLPRAVEVGLESALVAETLPVRLQPAIRDIWHDHVFFEGEEVTGFVDFGSLRVECVCGDIVRLLASLVGDDAEGWRCGLAAYEAIRPLDENERHLLAAFDRTAVALSGVNWLTWIYVERRAFEDPEAVRGRLDEIVRRLEALERGGGAELV